jgi:hypothetical protein
LEFWQDFRVDKKLHAARDAWVAANERLTFEGKHHRYGNALKRF